MIYLFYLLFDLLNIPSKFYINWVIISADTGLGHSLNPVFLKETDAAWKVSKYGDFSGPYFPVFGLNKEIYFRIQSEYRKIRTRKNSVLGHFSCSEIQLKGVMKKCYKKLDKFLLLQNWFLKCWKKFYSYTGYFSKTVALGKIILKYLNLITWTAEM